MVEPKVLLAVASIAAGIIFVSLWVIPGLYCVTKRWVLRQPFPTVKDVPMAVWLNKFFKFSWFSGPEYMIQSFFVSMMFWGLLMLMVGMIYVPILRWIVLSIAGVVFGLHALRWMFDTSRAMKKIKDVIHDHGKEEE